MKILLALLLAGMAASCNLKPSSIKISSMDSTLFDSSRTNAEQANIGFGKCQRYLEAWLSHRDSASGLIPRNLETSRDFWNARDAAADNYPFMVLTAFFVDSSRFNNTMLEMLAAERRLTSRVRSLPDTYSFSRKGFLEDTIKMDQIAFGTAEYIKDGLLPVTEWLGKSAWSDRMLEMLKDLHKEIEVASEIKEKGWGLASREEVNGDLLQVLSRMYWMTGDMEYLDWAIAIGDYYLLGDHHPTKNLTYLRLRDHGCELISGLCELYAAVNVARPDKKAAYQKPLTEMLDRILEVGRNEHGMFYDGINPQTGEITHPRIADNWGYTLNGFYTVYLIDKNPAYREAVLKVFSNLDAYRNFDWETGSADGYADAVEGALNLYNRIPDPAVAGWIDSEIAVMWTKQREDGIIEGWHGDGNFARTTIMYNLWKSKGLYVQPWRSDLLLGAEQKGDSLLITLKSTEPWKGKLFFDYPRSKENMKLPMDWPRINQFPEWFTVKSDQSYSILDLEQGENMNYPGNELKEGMDITLNGEKRLIVF